MDLADRQLTLRRHFLCLAHLEQGDSVTGGDATELWAALQMVLMLEGVEYRLK
jgi:hypothetical protein